MIGYISKNMNTYARKDVKFRVSVSVPAPGIFVLGHSLLGGTDVLGDAYQWLIYDNQIVSIDIQRNTDVTSGVFTTPTSNTAVVVIRDNELDPNSNPFVHPNTKIKVEWSPVGYSDWQSLITGFITSIETIYNQNSGQVIVINLEDMMNRLLTAPCSSFVQSAGLSFQQLMDLATTGAIASAGLNDSVYLVGVSNFSMGAAVFGALNYKDTTWGQVLSDLMNAELGLMYFDDDILVVKTRDWNINYRANQWNGFTTKFENFNSGYSSDYLFSDLFVSLASAPTVYYSKQNTDVSNFFGSITQKFTVNLNNYEELRKWMNSVTQYSPNVGIRSFNTPYFVPAKNDEYIFITNDYASINGPTAQFFVNNSISIDATSVSTDMTLWQPV